MEMKSLGGSLDVLRLKAASIGVSKEDTLTYDEGWESVAIPADAPSPGNRSVAGLHPITTGQGRNFLLLLMGESRPSSSGHDAAGEFRQDVWSFQLEPESMTAASLKDATRRLLNAKTGKNVWAEVDIPESAMTAGELPGPGPRGWFASAQGQDIETESIVLWGGVQPDNRRADDGWLLTIES